jgi:hypothetical protein
MRETLKSTMVWLPDQRETKFRNLRFQREREKKKKKKMRERWQLLFIGKNERRGEESVPFVCESVC